MSKQDGECELLTASDGEAINEASDREASNPDWDGFAAGALSKLPSRRCTLVASAAAAVGSVLLLSGRLSFLETAAVEASHPLRGGRDSLVGLSNKKNVSKDAYLVEEDDGLCAASGASCQKSQCCQEPGMQCYTKDNYWAQCMESCIPGPNVRDQVSPMPWACEKLGPRTPGKPQECTGDGEDCSETKCCKIGGTQCFRKNKFWSACRASCEPGPDLTSTSNESWECTALGPRTMGAAPWVSQQCAHGGEDCRFKKCCAEAGHQCYSQSSGYAQCRPSCTKGEKVMPYDPPWECDEIGERTPAFENPKVSHAGMVADWVPKQCSAAGESCMESKCCFEVGAKCVKKDENWAACRVNCDQTPDPNDGNKSWSCEQIGPQSWGLAVKGWPSLYCFSLYMPSSYEGGLLKSILQANGGIFQCDGYDVYAAEDDFLGTTKDGIDVKPVQIPKIAVGVSQDGTAGNAKLFMAVWDKVIAGGRFRNYDWTIKVDPDAVLIAWRIRDHMRPHLGQTVYVVNCNKFPGSPNFPMMYGAVEIFSQSAMIQYALNSWKCGQQLPWGAWGEDYYMTHCMDFIGVGRIGDFGVLGDNECTGANCADTYTASFHPFKDVGSWMQCWGQATAPR